MPYNWANASSDSGTVSAAHYIQAPPWASAFHIRTDPVAGAGADVDWKFLDKVAQLLFYDDSLSIYTNFTEENLDKFGGSVVTLDLMQTEDFLYIGFHRKVSGVVIDVAAADGGAGAILVEYWDGSAWSDTSATDSDSNLDTDSTWTFTVPSDWQPTKVNKTSGLFWLRYSTTADLDSEVEVTSFMGLSAETIAAAPAHIDAGNSEDGVEPLMDFDRRQINGIELLKWTTHVPTYSITWFGR